MAVPQYWSRPTTAGASDGIEESVMPSYTTSGTEKKASNSDNVSVHSGRLPVHSSDVEGSRRSEDSSGSGSDHVPKDWWHIHKWRVRKAGESGRSGIHPRKFFGIAFRSASPVSKAVNILWPVVPAAIAVRYALPTQHLVIFILCYLGMVPCANLIGFAGQELAKKVPHVFGVLTETTLGSLVEIVLFMVMITRSDTKEIDYTQVIQAAILGSVLATMLLCLGLCFIFGGLKRVEQTFSEAVSEAGSGLLLTAGFGLAVPTVFQYSQQSGLSAEDLTWRTLAISRSTAVLLMIAYLIFVYFQARTHHGIFDAIFQEDHDRHEHEHERERDHTMNGREKKGKKPRDKLTLSECALALSVSIALVALIAVALVDQIHNMVTERNISDAFVGLILVPLVEKAAEHLTAIDEAYDNQMNFALSHVLGATLQTALFNGPLVVLVGWGLDKNMGLDFNIFDLSMLILAIVTVGNFLRDQKSNYLEGSLCVIVYMAIAVAAYYTPNPPEGSSTGTGETGSGVSGTTEGVLVF